MKFLQSGWKKHIQRISTASFPSNREEKSCRKPKGTNPVLFNSFIELFHFCCSDSVQRGFKQTRLLWSLVACVKCLLMKTAKRVSCAHPSLPVGQGLHETLRFLTGTTLGWILPFRVIWLWSGWWKTMSLWSRAGLLPARWQCVRGYTMAGTEACLAARELLGAWLLWAMPDFCCQFWTICGYCKCGLLLAKQGWDRRLAMSCCRGAHLAKSHLCVSACTTMMCTHVSRVCTRRKKMFKNPCGAGTWGTLCLDFVWGN